MNSFILFFIFCSILLFHFLYIFCFLLSAVFGYSSRKTSWYRRNTVQRITKKILFTSHLFLFLSRVLFIQLWVPKTHDNHWDICRDKYTKGNFLFSTQDSIITDQNFAIRKVKQYYWVSLKVTRLIFKFVLALLKCIQTDVLW